jgi:hypothetical protein
MGAVTVHLRDHHAVEADVVTLTPDRDVITMVLASVRSGEERHGWVDENGEAVLEGKRLKEGKKKAGTGEGRGIPREKFLRDWKTDAEEARLEIESEMGDNLQADRDMQTDQAMQMGVD